MSRESLEELRDRLLRNEHAQELIRMRAFELYKLRGGHSGGEVHDWFQAESEVLTFLIEEDSRRSADSTDPSTVARKPAKRAAPKAASKTKEAAPEKATTKRTSKKQADSSQKPRGKKKKV